MEKVSLARAESHWFQHITTLLLASWECVCLCAVRFVLERRSLWQRRGESTDSSLKSFNGKLRGADLLVIQSPLEAGQSWGLPFKADLPLNGKN